MGASLSHPANTHGFLQAHVGVLVTLEQDSAIVVFAKSDVHGPERLDSTYMDFLHQEYLQVGPGSYDRPSSSRTSCPTSRPRCIEARWWCVPRRPVSISRTSCSPSASPGPGGPSARNGYVTVPLVSTYYPAALDRLNYYAEIYGTEEQFGADGPFALLPDRTVREQTRVRRLQEGAAGHRPARAGGDRELRHRWPPTGNYLLSVEVRDREGMLQGRAEQFFQRNNPVAYDLADMRTVQVGNTFADAINDTDTLAEFIRACAPSAMTWNGRRSTTG